VRDSDRALAAAKRLAVSVGFLLVAYLAGSAVGSVGVFVAVMALGLIVNLVLRARNAFEPR